MSKITIQKFINIVPKSLRFLILVAFPFAIYAIEKAELAESYKLILLGLGVSLSFRPKKIKEVVMFLALFAFMLAFAQDKMVRVYPFCVAMTVLAAFWESLQGDGRIFDGYAAKHGRVDPVAQEFLRKALKGWVLIQGINSAIFFVLIFVGSTEFWTLYTGVISYAVTGLMIAGTVLWGRVYSKRYRGPNA